MPALHIQLLGEFRLTYGDQPWTAIQHAREQALMAYLLLHRDAPQARQHVAFLFWPDSTEAQALTNLRNLLHKLRQNLPEPERFVHAGTQTVQWRPDAKYALDVAAFEAALARGDRAGLELAASLYRGDLLPNCYDDWVLPERARLHGLAMVALERLIALLEEARELRAAISCAERLQQLDPLNETTCRTLMRLHAGDNDRAGALSVYNAYASALHDDLAIDPSPETNELYRRLLNATAFEVASADAPDGQLLLVGRRQEWKMLQDAWHAACVGRPGCVLLTGEAGIGKTRLAEELMAWTGRQGFAAAAARCYAAEGTLAYAPVAAWLRSPALRPRLEALQVIWRAEVARIVPELLAGRNDLPMPGPLTEGWQRKRFFDALARAVVAQGEPVLLFLDDVQWCDCETLEWLHFLLHFDPRGRLLVVTTVRTEELDDRGPVSALLSALRRTGQLSDVALGPLNLEETALLAAQAAGGTLTPEQSHRVYGETEGNPLFVVETARYSLDAIIPSTETRIQQSLRSNPQALPPKIHAVLHSRLAQLSPQARDLARLAATIGREFTLGVLAGASDLGEDALVRSLDELWRRRIVREQGAGGYDFTHDKLREVAYTGQSAARRRLLHGHVARALEAAYGAAPDAVSGQVANHYELAGQFERAVPYYQRAADMACQLHAYADAARYYRRALALVAGPAGQAPALAAQLHERLGDLLHWTAQYEQARAAFLDALACQVNHEPFAQARLQRKIGNTWREQQRFTEALQAYAKARRILEQAASGETPQWWQEWIQVMLEVNLSHYWLGHIPESDAMRPDLQAALERHGTPGQCAAYFQNVAWIEFRRNRGVATDEVVALTKAALAAHLAGGNQAAVPAAHFAVGFVLVWSGDPQAGLEPLQTALHLAESTGDISLQARCLTYLTIIYRQCGQVEETRRCAARSLAVAAEANMPEYVGSAQANQAWVAWREGQLDLAKELGQAAVASWQQLPAAHASTIFQWVAYWPLLAIALWEERLPDAIGYAQALLDPAQRRLPDALAGTLEEGIRDWEQGMRASARARLGQSLSMAQQLRYL